jgi:predicted nucleic acid-binding protein
MTQDLCPHQLSFWDVLIERAAQQGGCATLYSENLQPD